MLFPFKYVPHELENLQGFIDWIFDEVWCKAPAGGDFRLELFDANSDLKNIMKSLYYGDSKIGDFFYTQIEKIYGCFSQLSPPQVSQLQRWYHGNNDIEKICAIDPSVEIVRYSELDTFDTGLCKLLRVFFKGLYSNRLLTLKIIEEKVGKVKDHYKTMMSAQDIKEVCPFCGIMPLRGANHTKREAYDHYLPKAKYPFSSINFRNLAPACNECNTSYKGAKDPLHTEDNIRRKAFYAYSTDSYEITVSVELATKDVTRIVPDDISLKFAPSELAEEIDTWREVYGIDERYTAKCCSDGNANYWYTQVMDEWKEAERPPPAFMKTLARDTQRAPYKEDNFIKKAFLEGCERKGLFANKPS